MKAILKKILAIILKLLFLDYVLLFLSKISFFISKLIHLRDWELSQQGFPQFFKHYINLNLWRFEPGRWSFVARGVYAREKMLPGFKVLDLCCGDATHSYLFFSDICGRIDAVDNDDHAISYARKFNKSINIHFFKVNIIEEDFPSTEYDAIVWNAGICYFSMENISLILQKIVNAGKPGLFLCGMLPKANGHADHITEFEDAGSVKKLLKTFFLAVEVKEVLEGAGNSITFYFSASNSISKQHIK